MSGMDPGPVTETSRTRPAGQAENKRKIIGGLEMGKRAKLLD